MNNANQPAKSTFSHFVNTNYSQHFQTKNSCGEQVLFVTFQKNPARQENFKDADFCLMKLSKKKIISAAIVTFVIAASAIGLFIFFAGRATTAAFSPCQYNLQVIEICKSNWKTANTKTASDIPSWDDLKSELRPYADRYGWTNGIPICPGGGTYIIGRVDEQPRCLIGGREHSLP